MGAAHKLEPHRRRLRLQHPGKDPIEHLTALVAVAVATHRGEMLNPYALGRHGLEHPGQPRTHRPGVGGGQGSDRLEGCIHQLLGGRARGHQPAVALRPCCPQSAAVRFPLQITS